VTKKKGELARKYGGRYAAILVTGLATAVIAPLLSHHDGMQWVLGLLILFVVVGSLRAVWGERRLFALVAAVGGGSVLMENFASFSSAGWSAPASDIVGALFLMLVCYGILSDIFSRDEITTDTVFGAAAVYLILGLLFARLFLLVEHLSPGSFQITGDLARNVTERPLGVLHYFSLITLTTVGYGDIIPISPFARSLAAVEAVIAQLYIAAVIARLVALYTAHAEARRRRDR
jgi:hypothetical protein